MIQPLKLTEAYRTEQRVKRRFAEAVRQFGLIEPGDRLLVGLSGGKDSLALLELLADYRRRCPFEFEVKALHVRMQGIDYLTDTSYLEDMASQCGVTLLVRTASFEADRNSRRTPCFLCSWNRRKQLFETAQAEGCNKIALGHHQDDILHTALMNLSFNGTFSTMPALLRMRKFPISIIRPLCLEHETDIAFLAKQHNYVKQVKSCPHEKESRRTEAATQFEQLCRFAPEFRQNLWHALLKEGKLVETE